MSDEGGAVTLYSGSGGAITESKKTPYSIKAGIAQILRGEAIIEVTSIEQAKIAESAGSCCVLATEPDRHGILRMSDPSFIKQIKCAVTIPVMSRVRVGHFVEAQILERIGVDYIDESEVLDTADSDNFINKHKFGLPFACGSRNLGEALRRLREGAAMIRIQGQLSETGDISETVKSLRRLMGDLSILNNMDDDEVFAFSKKIEAPYDMVAQTKQLGRLPVAKFAAGGIVTPADVALMMQLGCDGVFIGSEVFNSSDPLSRLRGILQAARHYNDPQVLVESYSMVSEDDSILRISSASG